MLIIATRADNLSKTLWIIIDEGFLILTSKTNSWAKQMPITD